MEKRAVTAVVLGASGRGKLCSDYALEHPEDLKIVGIAELVDLRRTMYGGQITAFRSKTGSQRGSRCSTGLNSPMRSLSRRPTTCITSPCMRRSTWVTISCSKADRADV